MIKIISFSLAALVFSQLSFAQAPKTPAQKAETTIGSLAHGRPTLESNLGTATFVPFQVERLAHPMLAYLDYDYFRQRGVKIPSEGIQSPQLAKDALDAFAWMTRGQNDPADAFTSEVREFYAYYYGGGGLGGNIGSGRSAAFGEFDEKGLRTPLVKSGDPYHSNGAAITIEAIDEAIWSRILQAESVFGANRVVGVIFTGTWVPDPSDHNRMLPRALIVREMGIRPAHHMTNYKRPLNEDQARVVEARKSLLDNLPYPSRRRPKSDAEAFRAGVLEVARREGVTQARLFARRIYFGSNSPSNLELKSRRLDLGDHTTQEGFTKIIRISDESPFGETDEFKRILEEIRKDLISTAAEEWKSTAPTKQEVAASFDQAFESSQRLEMLELSGAPPEFVKMLANSPVAQRAGEAILKIALDGNYERVHMEPAGYPNTSTYNLGQVLAALTAAISHQTLETSQALKDALPNARLHKELIESYSTFWSELEQVASKVAVSSANLKTYARLAVETLNRTRPSLIRGDRRWHELWRKNDEALHHGDRLAIQNYVDSQVQENRQIYNDRGDLQLVLRQTEANTAEGWAVRRIFDLKTGRLTNVLRLDVASGEVMFKGQRYKADEVMKSAIEIEGQESRFAAANERTVRRGAVEISFAGDKELHANLVRINKTAAVATRTELVVVPKLKSRVIAPSCPNVFSATGS